MKIYNTLTGRKEEFVPLEEGKVRMYACGITVSGEAHIGHGYQALIYDIMRKYLQKKGFKVTYARNYTDVDDKIIAKSKETGIPADVYAAKMIEDIDEVMGDPLHLFFGNLRGTDVHVPVHLHGVGADDFSVQRLRQFYGKFCFSHRRRAGEHQQRFFHLQRSSSTQSAGTSVPVPGGSWKSWWAFRVDRRRDCPALTVHPSDDPPPRKTWDDFP